MRLQTEQRTLRKSRFTANASCSGRLITQQKNRSTQWNSILDTIYSIGTIFAQKQKGVPEEQQSQAHPELVNRDAFTLDPSKLQQDHGVKPLMRTPWGATFTAYLYDFLRQLQWDDDSYPYTQWVEL